MSYSTIETAALSVIRLLPVYDDSNCQAGDSSPLKKGYERVVKLLYGGGVRNPLTLTTMQHTWTVNVDVYVPYRGELSVLESTLATERQTIIDQLAKYPRLNNCTGVVDAEITNGNKPEPLNSKRSPYRGQRLYLLVQEVVYPGRVE
jgi:hypothetical protein